MRIDAAKLLAGCTAVLLMGACNKAPQTPDANTETAAEAARAEADAAAATAREADLARRESQLATREADIAAASARTRNAPPNSRPAPGRPAPDRQPPPNQPAPSAARPAPNSSMNSPVVLVVPSGTQLSLSLAKSLSSKTARIGDTVRANVTQDVRVNDRVAIAAGTTVAGTVTDVVSGSSKIGGVPTLGLRFERLELPGNIDVPIDGVLIQKGKSDTGRDTAKIVGGAAAGAILGDQVKGGDKGKVLGGLLGGAIGAVAAQKTGTEVTLEAGTDFAIALTAPVEINRR